MVAHFASQPGAPYGAMPGDWAHFVRLGLEDDLLPVVSDPAAKIDPKSKLQGLGKTPSRYNQAGLVVGLPKWTSHVTTDRDVERWTRDSRLGICVQTRVVRAIDIDIEDPVAAAAVREFIELGAGLMPLRRRSGSGKCLLMFKMPGDFTKRILRTAHGAIEFLANGQQFVAIGTHPKGMRYEWVRPSGEIGLPEEIPELSPEHFEGMWAELVKAFGLPDGERRERRGLVPTKPRQAGDLRDPTVAWLDENGWLIEVDRSGRADIRCPFEAEHTTDSAASATSYFPAGVGGFQQGHFRCLHAHCAGRTDGDFVEALGIVADEFEVVDPEEEPLPTLTRSKNGSPIANVSNFKAVQPWLERHNGYRLGADRFAGDDMIDEGSGWRPISDTDFVKIRILAERAPGGFRQVGKDVARDAILAFCEEHAFDSAQQWAATLQWDGVERIDSFLPTFFGVEDSPYARAVGAYIWTALAGRCVCPGVKADMVPVFIGAQGAGKSTAVEAMAPLPGSFAQVNLQERDADLARTLRGKLIGEIAELRGLQSRDAESIKAWISRTEDEWVPKYRERAIRHQRRIIFIGTTNTTEFLDDETGERRWLPVQVGQVDVAGIRAARDQLWAEGVERFNRFGVEYHEAQRLARDQHAAFKVEDPWLGRIAAWLDTPDDFEGETATARRGDKPLRLADVMQHALGLQSGQETRAAVARATACLRRLGFSNSVRRVCGDNVRVWIKP